MMMWAKFKYCIIIVIALISLVIAWQNFRDKTEPVGLAIVAKTAAELQDVPHVDITPPKVAVYAQPAKKKLGLPVDVQENSKQYVLASVKLPNDPHPHTVTTVMDATTGDVQTFTRRDPLPWLKPEQTGEVRIDYGIKNGMAMVARLSVREDLLQVKALHAGVNVTLDTDGQYFIGGGVGWRW